jgi:3-oxoadipate enol-lactonase
VPELTTVDGATIHWREDGDPAGPPVLLAHALGTDLTLFDAQIRALHRFRLVRYDARGHGRSSVREGPTTIARLGRDALAVLDAAGIERAAVAGVSMGGMVAMWLGLEAQARVSRLALCNTYARNASTAVWDERIATVRERGIAAIVDGAVDRWLTRGFQEREPVATARVRAMLLACDPAGYTAACAAVRDMDLLDRLAAITAPVLVIDGLHDPTTRPDAARAMTARLPRATLVELEAAHLASIEAAAAFNDALAAFLSS